MQVRDDGTEAWFVTLEEGAEAPSLGEMLVTVTKVNLASGEAVEVLDGKLEDGGVLLGYVSEGVVEVHSPLAVPYPPVVERIKAVFGSVRVIEVVAGLIRRVGVSPASS